MIPEAIRLLLRTTPSIAPIPNRALLSVSGPHATDFLNGLLASSVPKPPRGPFFSVFLHAQGKVLHDVFVYTSPSAAAEPEYFIEYDPSPSLLSPPLLTILKRYVLRSKVTIRDVSDEQAVWAVWGGAPQREQRRWSWARSGVVQPVWGDAKSWPWGSGSVKEGRLELTDRRAVGMGRRIVMRKGETPPEYETHESLPSSAYTLHRVLHGVPEGSVDIPSLQTFPTDSNLDVMGGLDFRKGCYVGQELTVRTFHTGFIRKRILPVLLTLSNPGSDTSTALTPAPNARIHVSARPNSACKLVRTGRLLTTTPEGVALARLHVELAEVEQRGEVALKINGNKKAKWEVKSWWPDWWP